jgi:hypothetical protein
VFINMPAGFLNVNVVSGHDMKNKVRQCRAPTDPSTPASPLTAAPGYRQDILTKMDPYVVVRLGGQEKTTSVKGWAGSGATWEEMFAFNVQDGQNVLTVRAMDHDTFSRDDLIGEGELGPPALCPHSTRHGCVHP